MSGRIHVTHVLFILYFFPIQSLITYFDILQFKKQCVLSDFSVIICYTVKMSLFYYNNIIAV